MMPKAVRTNELEPEFQKLSDDELKAKPGNSRQDSPMASPLMTSSRSFRCRPRSRRRTIGLRHYDVQLLGGITLHMVKSPR